MTQSRENFNRSISFITRTGISELISWLETETDFFTAPSSTNFHGNYEGGLLDHSLNVLYLALHNFNFYVNQNPELEYLRESVVICSLFHDLCKINTYVTKQKWAKDEQDKWKQYTGYAVEDKFPLGHGEKSVYYISKFIKLTDAEALAIRWHMGPFETSIHTNASPWAFAFYQAIDHPLVRLIHCADMLSIGIEEKKNLKN